MLNSKLLFYYFSSYTPFVQGRYFKFEPQYLKVLPIVPFRDAGNECVKISELSKHLHTISKKLKVSQDEIAKNAEIKKLTLELNELVYKLYGITEKEKMIIEKA